MTRLKENWIEDIEKGIVDCQDYLSEKTGRSFKTILREHIWPLQTIKVAVIPVTQGQGIIGHFAESVASVIRVMDFEVFITEETDVAGIYEAACKKADVIFMADDSRFIAWNLKTGEMADNNIATAVGYVNVLEGALGSLKKKGILLLGYGTVGEEICKVLEIKEANVTVYDRDVTKQKKLRDQGIKTIKTKEEIKEFEFVIDATNTGDWLRSDMLHDEVWYVSPGVPLSLDAAAYNRFQDRIIHDYLQIGVATMLAMVLQNNKIFV